MRGWIPIDPPEPQALTPTEQRVKELLDSGYNYKLIAMIMRMSAEATKDMIYEIRKKEGIMRKAIITDEEKQTMKRMFAEGKTVQEIADATGRGRSSVDRIVNDRKPAQINPEFDAAVNEMIAEAKVVTDRENDEAYERRIAAEFDADLAAEAADAEQKFANAEPEKLPGVVCRAIDAGFHYLADEIDKRQNRIEELEAEIEEFEKDIAALRKWREAHP